MTIGQHEAVAIGPDRVQRVELHIAVPDRVDQGGEGHGSSGMPGFGLLNSIDREGPDRIYGQLDHIGTGHCS